MSRTWLPPHARGCTDPGHGLAPRKRASPARAGMYRADTRVRTQPKSFPRTRGDVPGRYPSSYTAQKLPPHARGCTGPIPEFVHSPKASPARAGMYPAARCPAASPTCSPPPPPRARGRTRYNPPFPFPVGANGRPVAVRRHLPHPSAVASVRGLRAESGRDRRMARLVRRAAARRPRAPRPPEPLRAAGLADAASLRPPARSGPRAGAGQA